MKQWVSVIVMLFVVACLSGHVLGLTANPPMGIDVTSSPDHVVMTPQERFGFSGTVAAWADNRNDSWAVYGVNLDDPCYVEFLVATTTMDISQVRITGDYVVYRTNTEDGSNPGGTLWLADISNQASPVVTQLATNVYPGVFDVKADQLVWIGRDPVTELCHVKVQDLTNLAGGAQTIYEAADTYFYDITIDGAWVTWCGQDDSWNNYVRVADISELANPDIQVFSFIEHWGYFSSVDASGTNLVVDADMDGGMGIYLIPNYQDVANWQLKMIHNSACQGWPMSTPRIDGRYIVWVSGIPHPAPENGNAVMGAYILDDGRVSVSEIVHTGSMDATFQAAEIENQHVLVSMDIGSLSVSELFYGDLLLGCGDWGYDRADFDQDCDVDLMDFAVLAQEWLKCTVPGVANCQYGQIGLL